MAWWVENPNLVAGPDHGSVAQGCADQQGGAFMHEGTHALASSTCLLAHPLPTF